MKTSSYPLFVKVTLSFALVLFCSSFALSQITQVEFMKVNGDVDDYLKVEQEWKKVHQRRLDNDLIYAWYLVRRHLSGTGSEYDYMTVTVFPSMNAVFNPYSDDLFEGLDQDIIDKTAETRDLVKTELFDTPLVLEITNLPQFLNMEFMKVNQGNDDTYLEMEDELWKAAHLVRKQQGVLTSWSVYRQFYPGGYGGEYNYVVVNGFADLKKVTFEPEEGWEEFMKKIHPDMAYSDLISRTLGSRVLIKTELWELVDSVYPK